MAVYGVLGATGQVGGSIVQVLLQSPEKQIRVFVRSRRKLLSQRPELESLPNVTIYEGQLDDVDRLAEFITGTTAVFLAVGAIDNVPGCDVARQQAKGIVAALELVRKREPRTKLPQLIVLSSASLDKHLMRNFPAIGAAILKTALGNIYSDLQLAEDYLRSYEWIKQVYVKPGGLVHDEPKGHMLSTDRQETFLSYLDLAAGMVEIADADHDKWDLKNVSVVPASPGTRFEWRVPYFALRGMLWQFLPWTYPYLSPWL